MAKDAQEDGAENAKVPDSDIQGTRGGKRNRDSTDAGVMPPPAGEPRTSGADPRDPTLARKEK